MPKLAKEWICSCGFTLSLESKKKPNCRVKGCGRLMKPMSTLCRSGVKIR